jgi:hypothetical protein
MPIPPKLKTISIARGIKGFENREFETTLGVASSTNIVRRLRRFLFSEITGETGELCLTDSGALVNIPVCLGRV